MDSEYGMIDTLFILLAMANPMICLILGYARADARGQWPVEKSPCHVQRAA